MITRKRSFVVARIEQPDETTYLVMTDTALSLRLLPADSMIMLKNSMGILNCSVVEKDGVKRIRVAKGIPTYKLPKMALPKVVNYFYQMYANNPEQFAGMIENAFEVAVKHLRANLPHYDVETVSNFPTRKDKDKDFGKDNYYETEDGKFCVHYSYYSDDMGRYGSLRRAKALAGEEEKVYASDIVLPKEIIKIDPIDFEDTAERRVLIRQVQREYLYLKELLGDARVEEYMQDCYKTKVIANLPNSHLREIVEKCKKVRPYIKANGFNDEMVEYAEAVLLTRALFGNFVDRQHEHIRGLVKVFSPYLNVMNSGFHAFWYGPTILALMCDAPDPFIRMQLRLGTPLYVTPIYKEVLVEMMLRMFANEKDWRAFPRNSARWGRVQGGIYEERSLYVSNALANFGSGTVLEKLNGDVFK